MRTIVSILQANLRLVIILLAVALLIVLHYISKTPEPANDLRETETFPNSLEGVAEKHETSLTSAEAPQSLKEESSEIETLVQPPLAEVETEAETTLEPVAEPTEPIVEAYCVKCKLKRIMLLPQESITKNGRKAMTGTCPVCGTRLFRFI